MKLLFKQRFFSWFDSYDIFDEGGQVVYTVQGQLSWGHCLHIYDAAGQHIGTVKERVFTFLPRFECYVGDSYMGSVCKEFSFFRPKFVLDCNGWNMEGDFMEWDYRIVDAGGNYIASIGKELFNFTDTYSLTITDPNHALLVLMLALAIDAEKCSRN